MRPIHRSPVNKRHGARKFKKHVGKTKAANVVHAPMRGGWRL